MCVRIIVIIIIIIIIIINIIIAGCFLGDFWDGNWSLVDGVTCCGFFLWEQDHRQMILKYLTGSICPFLMT